MALLGRFTYQHASTTGRSTHNLALLGRFNYQHASTTGRSTHNFCLEQSPRYSVVVQKQPMLRSEGAVSRQHSGLLTNTSTRTTFNTGVYHCQRKKKKITMQRAHHDTLKAPLSSSVIGRKV